LKEMKDEIEAFVKQSQDGDHDAFAKLYDIFIDPIYRYVYYRVNADDAEDIVETVFLKVWENLARYKSTKKAFSAWVFRIAHNLVVDYYRASKERRHDELPEDLKTHQREHSPIKQTEQALDSEILKIAIKKLKKNYQEVIVYKFINDLSNPEIAEILKRSEGSLRILQHRALKALKRELGDMGIKYVI